MSNFPDRQTLVLSSSGVTEFASVSRAIIQAALAENSFSYTHSRETLTATSGKSWRFAISTWWNRRKPVPDLPSLCTTTGSAELNRELHDLHAPFARRTTRRRFPTGFRDKPGGTFSSERSCRMRLLFLRRGLGRNGSVRGRTSLLPRLSRAQCTRLGFRGYTMHLCFCCRRMRGTCAARHARGGASSSGP